MTKAETILKRLKRNRNTLLKELMERQSDNSTAPPENAESPLLKELSEWQNMENEILKR